MIVLIEPISNNIGMYVPAYPLPLLEVASFIKAREPQLEIRIISVPVDYGLPLDRPGKDRVYRDLLDDLARMRPRAVGISCTAISQAEETIDLCERIKGFDPGIFIFLGGYFPSIYPEEIFSRTHAVDLIVLGEGETPALHVARALGNGDDPKTDVIPNLAWKVEDHIHYTPRSGRFDLEQKALLNMTLLKASRDFSILPYAFSRGCPYRCEFCMEDQIRPQRQALPYHIVEADLKNLLEQSSSRSLLVADALFKSFDLFPLFRSLGVKVNFETRCDVLDAGIIPEISDACGSLALGFESASYRTLRRMNKVRNRSHYERYMANTEAIFRAASRHDIPMMVFMILGYPGDTEEDLQQSLDFARRLSSYGGSGGHVFKVGECRVYPKTRLYGMASAMPDVIFDDDGVFGKNVVRQASKGLTFETVMAYMDKIFRLSNPTKATRDVLLNMMPFFRLPASAIADEIIPGECFRDAGRSIFDAKEASLSVFRRAAPGLLKKYGKKMSGERSSRTLTL